MRRRGAKWWHVPNGYQRSHKLREKHRERVAIVRIPSKMSSHVGFLCTSFSIVRLQMARGQWLSSLEEAGPLFPRAPWSCRPMPDELVLCLDRSSLGLAVHRWQHTDRTPPYFHPPRTSNHAWALSQARLQRVATPIVRTPKPDVIAHHDGQDRRFWSSAPSMMTPAVSRRNQHMVEKSGSLMMETIKHW